MSLNRIVRWRFVVLAALLLASLTAHAAMQMDRTRIVLQEADASATLHLYSEDPRPLLVQAWIDDGKGDSNRDQPADVPFIIDPPVVYLSPGRSHALRVLRVSAPGMLPAGRESLYWVNVREIPATANTTTNQLHISVQSRLKLFYRPQALARHGADGHHQALTSAERLRFALERDDVGQTWLCIHNPAPIHQNLAALTLHIRDAAPVTLDAPMLAPFDTQRLLLPQTVGAPPLQDDARLTFAMIDDDGSLIDDAQTLSVCA